MTSRTIATDDQQFHVNESGQGNDHKVLWLHGSGPGVTAASNWRGVLDDLDGDFHNIAPDMIGFADSSHPDPAPLGGDFMALRVAALIDLMDTMEVDRFDLVGNSYGVAVASRIVERIPDRVGRLVFMGGAAGPPGHTPGLARIQTFGDDPTVDNLAEILESFVYDPAPWQDRIREVAEERVPRALREDVMRSHRATFSPDGPPPSPVDYSSFEHQTLVVHGADDQVLLLQSGIDLFHAVPNAELHVFSRCGHWVQIERAREFVTLVRNFLKGGD